MNAEQKALFDKLTKLQQRVATNVLSGMSQRQAYMLAGGSANSDDSADATSSQLLSNPKVVAFMDAMKVQAVSDAIMTKDEAMKVLSQLARGNLTDIVNFRTVEIGKDMESGQPVYQTVWTIPEELQRDDPERLVIISELEVGKNGPKIKTHSKSAAIAQLSKMQGWDAPTKIQGSVTTTSVELTDAQRAALDRAIDTDV